MAPLADEYQPAQVEEEVRAFWKTHHLPPTAGSFGPAGGPTVRQFVGTFTPGDPVAMVAQRALAADVDARYLALTGRRTLATLRREGWSDSDPSSPVERALERLGVWVGGSGAGPSDSEDRHARVERIVGQLARRGIIATRDLPLRVCPSCAAPRSPERIIYQEEEGDTYLVRFDVPLDGRVARALVWVDAPWRLLATSAILVNPDLPYVVARYRRRDFEELVLTSRSSLERFRSWIPGATFDVLEERPGREYAGRAYGYPLAHEFPMGGALAPPAGTVLGVPDVTDTGTGLVPLVPGHGATDAVIAEAHGIPGWPLVTPTGRLDVTLKHKYAGLDLRTATEFIVRDLGESGAVFAQLRVRRGVPHCALCGSALVWTPGRAWCLEPGRLSAELAEMYRRLLPAAPALPQVEVAPWPVSETTMNSGPSAVALLECPSCESLDSLDASPSCACGGTRYPIRRRLVPSAAGVFAAWARSDPFPGADTARLYVGERRAVPTVVHHLMALAGVDGIPAEVGVTLLPTVTDIDLVALADQFGADAMRTALVRTDASGRATETFVERCVQERDRLDHLWRFARELSERLDPALLAAFSSPVSGTLGELEIEDRALLARWERSRVQALADYDRWSAASAHRRVVRFFETDLAEYREWVRPRIALAGGPGSKRAALRTLVHVLSGAVALLAPVVPYAAERIRRALVPDRASLYDGRLAPVDRGLMSDDLAVAWDRWRSVLAALRAFRRANGLPHDAPIPSVALVVGTDDLGTKLRDDRPLLERLGNVTKVVIGSPSEVWTGRQRQVRPNESEIQRVYGSQASQIAHLLRRMPPRRVRDPGGGADLSVVIQGLPRTLTPSMVSYSESLPERVVPSPWGPGEMYVECPVAGRPSTGPPPLSPDAFWLVRRVDRRLRRGRASGSVPSVAVVATSDPLAAELSAAAGPIAAYLGLAEVRVNDRIEEPAPSGRITGRTKTGAHWWVDVPGLTSRPRRTKVRASRQHRRRFPSGFVPVGGVPVEVDYAAEEVVSREQAIRALNQELDAVLGVPVLGPTKVAVAWDKGLRRVEQFRGIPFEDLSALPGFGPAVVERLFARLGNTPSLPAVSRPAPVAASLRERARASAAPPVGPATLDLSAAVPATGETRSPTLAVTSPVASVDSPDSPELPAASPPSMAGSPASIVLPPGSVGETGDQPPTTSLVPVPASSPLVPSDPRDRPLALVPADAPFPQQPPTDEPGLGSAEAIPIPPSPDTPSVNGEAPHGAETVGAPEVPSLHLEAPTAAGARVDGAPPETPEKAAEPPGGTEFDQVSTPLAPEPPTGADEPTAPARSGPEADPTSAIGSVGDASTTDAPDAEPVAPVGGDAAPAGPPAPESVIPLAPEAEPPTPTSGEPGPLPPQAPPPEPPAAPEPAAIREPPAPVGSTSPPGSPDDTPVALPALLPIEPAREAVPVPPMAGVELEVGSSILNSLQPFLDATAAGHLGLCLVRESPERISAQIGRRPVDVYWLTNLGRGRTLKPNDLSGVFASLTRTITEEGRTVVFVEGLEYLVRVHGVDAVVDRLAEFDRVAKEHDVRVWTHVSPDLLRPADLERIVRRFGRSDPPA